jgi:hypothetical protein
LLQANRQAYSRHHQASARRIRSSMSEEGEAHPYTSSAKTGRIANEIRNIRIQIKNQKKNFKSIWSGEPRRAWSRRQSSRRPLVRATRPSSSRPSCRSNMLQTTGRAGLLPTRVTGRMARSTSRTPRGPCVPVCKVGRPIRSGLKCEALLFMRSTVEASSSQPNEPTLASPERAASAVPAGASSQLKPEPCCISFPRRCRTTRRFRRRRFQEWPTV